MTNTQYRLTINGKTYTHNIDPKGVAGGALWSALFGAIIFVIAYASPSWVGSSKSYYGIWQYCSCSTLNSDQDEVKAIQAMETIGLIGIVFTLLLVASYFFLHNTNVNTVLIALVIVSCVTVIFITIGLIIFGKHYENRGDFKISFALACAGDILILLCAIFGMVQLKNVGLCC